MPFGDRIWGSGTLETGGEVFNIGGTIISGQGGSIGGLQIVGDYDQGPDGVLVVALGEHSASTPTLTGNAALGGTLFMTSGDELVEDGVYHYLVLVPAADLALPVETRFFMGTTINLAD